MTELVGTDERGWCFSKYQICIQLFRRIDLFVSDGKKGLFLLKFLNGWQGGSVLVYRLRGWRFY